MSAQLVRQIASNIGQNIRGGPVVSFNAGDAPGNQITPEAGVLGEAPEETIAADGWLQQGSMIPYAVFYEWQIDAQQGDGFVTYPDSTTSVLDALDQLTAVEHLVRYRGVNPFATPSNGPWSNVVAVTTQSVGDGPDPDPSQSVFSEDGMRIVTEDGNYLVTGA